MIEDTMHLGPEIEGRPTVRGIVAVKVKGQDEPGFVWCEGPGKSISLLCKTPGEARRMKPPLFGRLARWQIERAEVERWQRYTPPRVSLVDLLKRARGM